ENEDRLLSILKSAGDISANSRELQFYQTDWPSIYHLSSLRGNLLRPFLGHFSSGKSVLELGAGCGEQLAPQ
ncbi:MAG: protein N-lysine methyltransferase family protein, partial [Holophagaceae bacterium]|nr:protein N-lysine methyltransferase family protein [Holophagaceae bacterium]